MNILETCEAIINNPIETLDIKHPNFEDHHRNMERLYSKGIIYKNNKEFIFIKDDLKKFIKNKGLTDTEISKKKDALRSNLALLLSFISLIIAFLALYQG